MLDYHAPYPVASLPPTLVLPHAVDPVVIPVAPEDNASCQVNDVGQELTWQVSANASVAFD